MQHPTGERGRSFNIEHLPAAVVEELWPLVERDPRAWMLIAALANPDRGPKRPLWVVAALLQAIPDRVATLPSAVRDDPALVEALSYGDPRRRRLAASRAGAHLQAVVYRRRQPLQAGRATSDPHVANPSRRAHTWKG
jgi:hypothetical protein